MNKLHTIFFLLIICTSCNIMRNKLIIEGELTGLQSGDSLFFTYRDKDFRVQTDTCIAKKGNFHFEKEWEEATIYTLISKKSSASLVIVAENKEKVYIKGALNNLSKASIYTYQQQKAQQAWERASFATQEQLYEIQVRSDAAGKNGDILEQKRCLSEYEDLLKKEKEQIVKFCKLHQNDIVSASLAARYLNGEQDLKALEEVYALFSYKVQGSKYGREIERVIENLKRTAIGQNAPVFSLKDKNKKSIQLKDFQGKYVLLDFWASWCVPCRKENPFLQDLYEKYPRKDLEIIGISLDKREEDWLNAIQKDSILWVQLTDFKAIDSEVVKLYDIKDLPSNFLLDPKGKIIAKNLHGNELAQKLAELMPK